TPRPACWPSSAAGPEATGGAGDGGPRAAPAQSEQPTSVGSLTSSIPKRSRTPSRTVRASASRSAVVAPPRLVSARACLVDSDTRPPGPGYPRPKPAWSMSQAALTFTRPSGWGQAGAPGGPRDGSTIGLVEHAPALQGSW